MRTINYKELIKESVEELVVIEKKENRGRTRDRIKLLRLLKSGQYSTLKEVSKVIGITYQSGKNLLNTYKIQRIEGVTKWKYKGKTPRVSYEQLTLALDWQTQAPMSLEQARSKINQRFNVNYCVSGIWYLFNTYKIKLKTGRPRNYRKEEEKEEGFKKTLKTW
jgi:transposase